MKAEDFYIQFEGWLQRVCASDQPANEVIAFNIGLFETEDGYAAYLTGSSHYSMDDDEWACNEDFIPKEGYFYFPVGFAQNLNWKEAQQATIKAVKKFLDKNPESFLAKANAVTVGFDEGDLVRVL